ncbi:hypothetical protein SAMN05444166_2027 [Singulisphaera sp. GP187]|uniref:hypothetical protein n=1 Tax=Singulisphaera sp. GP187 TaxID=1882752 RepID=UPI00092A48A6|nr:hypothetical protein [Singulisphaera sp. GP187]SIO01108.1 hypothetical protein SAMN05444166_2027 [Singulisphaera sp. GP187]
MTDESSLGGEIHFIRLFPWLRLFRGIGVSIDPKKLFLAAIGLIALNAGWGALDRAFPSSDPRIPAGLSSFATDSAGGGVALDLGLSLWQLTEPVQCLIAPFLALFSLRSGGGLSMLHAFLAAVWAVIVWGIIGGAIARIATVKVAAGERMGVRKALEFALGKSIPLVLGPLSPLIGVAILAVPCACFGLLYRLPASIGPVIAGVLLVLPLLAGLVMALILVGLATGWPLMHASVAAEAEDGFDALSRSYAYVFQRPLRYASYLVLAWIIGLAGLAFVSIFAQLVVQMAHWSLSISAPHDPLEALFQAGRVPLDSAPAKLHTFWLAVVGLLAHGWIYSYFWSAASIIYLLIRQDVDGTDWRQIALPPAPPNPLMPAVEPIGPPADPTNAGME